MSVIKVAAWLAALGAAAHFSMAQEFRGTILGRVTDPSGAVIPGAQVSVTNEETCVRVDTKTKMVRQGIVVQVNAKVTLDLTLELGATTEAVAVSGESPLLQTASADLGLVVDRHMIDRVSIQNAVNLIDLAPARAGRKLAALAGLRGRQLGRQRGLQAHQRRRPERQRAPRAAHSDSRCQAERQCPPPAGGPGRSRHRAAG